MSGRPRGRQYRDRRSFSSSDSDHSGPGTRGSRSSGPLKRPLRRRSSHSLSPLMRRGKASHSRSPHSRRELTPVRNRVMSRSPKSHGAGYPKKRSLTPLASQHALPHKSQRLRNTDSFRYTGTNRKSPTSFGKKPYSLPMNKLNQSSKYKDYKFENRSLSSGRDHSDSSRRPITDVTSEGHNRDPGLIDERRLPYTKDSYESRIEQKGFDSGRDHYRRKEYSPSLPSNSYGSYREPSIPKRDGSKPSFSRADLEKITIDIRRNVKDPSPTRRAIIDPSDIKVVRRNNEGSRAIFDREEIRNPTVDLREDAMMERRVVTVKPSDREMGGALRADKGARDMYSDPQMTLSQRWQSYDDRKSTQRVVSHDVGYQKEFRERSIDKTSRPRLNSMSRESRYKDESPGRGQFLDNPDDLRHNLGGRKDTYGDYKRKNYDDNRSLGDSRIANRETRGSSGYNSSSSYRQVGGEGDLPDFSQRPDRFKYTEWLDKPEVIPKGSSYFEHDDRSKPFLRSRGRSRPFRGPHSGNSTSTNFSRNGGNFRGFASPRGGRMLGRGPFRGPRGYQRGARGNYNSNYSNRTGSKSSPHLWEHDLYSKSPSEKGNKSP